MRYELWLTNMAGEKTELVTTGRECDCAQFVELLNLHPATYMIEREEFGTAVIQQQVFIAVEFPPKTVWTDSLTFENVTRKEAEQMLLDMQHDEKEFALRLAFTPNTLEN